MSDSSDKPSPNQKATAFHEQDEQGCQLVLVKDGERFVFRYTPGEESHMLNGLVDMVGEPASKLDWFDIAVLSHQLGRHMGRTLNETRKKTSA